MSEFGKDLMMSTHTYRVMSPELSALLVDLEQRGYKLVSITPKNIRSLYRDQEKRQLFDVTAERKFSKDF